MAEERKKLTVPDLREAKRSGRKLAMASILAYSWLGVILVSREARPDNLIKGVRI